MTKQRIKNIRMWGFVFSFVFLIVSFSLMLYYFINLNYFDSKLFPFNPGNANYMINYAYSFSAITFVYMILTFFNYKIIYDDNSHFFLGAFNFIFGNFIAAIFIFISGGKKIIDSDVENVENS